MMRMHSDGIDRRNFLQALAGGTAAALAGPALFSSCAGRPKPNFVIVLTDDLGYGDLACYGHPVIQTPNLDAFAQNGMQLTDCYAAAPVCSPARAGMLTGRTPNRCGIFNWIPPGSPMHLQKSEITVATLLKNAGYQTCLSGKWHCNGHFNSPDQPQPNDHGFDHWFATQNNALPNHRNPHNFVRNGEPCGPQEGFSSTMIIDEAVSWLNRIDRARPFCLFVWFHSPHEIVATSEEYTERYMQDGNKDRATYFGNVTHLDHEFGRLTSTLDALNLRDDTFIMFTSDNGPETLLRYPGAQYSYGTTGPLRGMKLDMYEGGIRIPGIIQWPGRTKPGQVSPEPVSGTDVLPTLCAIAGIDVPADRPIDGASILPLFDGQPVNRSIPLYWQYNGALSRPKAAMRQGDWKLLAGLTGSQISPRGSLSQDQLDAMAAAELTDFELYNLQEDVGETKDRSRQEPARLNQMQGIMRELFESVKAESPHWPAWERPQQKIKDF